MFSKVNVNGKNAHPLFQYLRTNSSMKGSKIGWNFGKFLIDKQSNIVGYYGPNTNPVKMIPDIESNL
jgi:glutathione peroxidase